MEAFKTQATIEGISTRKDKSCKIIIGTQEMAPEEKAQLFNLADDFGWFIFAPFEMEEVVIPDQPIDAVKKPGKSKQQELREVIYIYYKNIGGDVSDRSAIDAFYDKQIDYIIGKYKEKL